MEEIRTIEILPKGTILISGGGPVGLVLALVLAHHGQGSVLIEQNIEATRYGTPFKLWKGLAFLLQSANHIQQVPQDAFGHC